MLKQFRGNARTETSFWAENVGASVLLELAKRLNAFKGDGFRTVSGERECFAARLGGCSVRKGPGAPEGAKRRR